MGGKIFSLFLLITVFCSCRKEDDNAIRDGDGNVYHSVQIGDQVWLLENLKTTKYNDGTPIPLIADPAEWSVATVPGYCWLNNDASTNKKNTGALYNWYTVDRGNICPKGWHSPSMPEWSVLVNSCGGKYGAGYKLKEAGSEHWGNNNEQATNESGFTALPGGYRDKTGTYFGRGSNTWFSAKWWSSNEVDGTTANRIGLGAPSPFVDEGSDNKNEGHSVRCIKGEDEDSDSPLVTTLAASEITESGAILWGIVNAKNLPSKVIFEYGTSPGYTNTISALADTVEGNLDIEVNTVLSGLAPGTIYHYRITARSIGGTSHGGDMVFTTGSSGDKAIFFNPALTYGTVTDIDNNTYRTINIGTQEWMAENLKTTRYNDGTEIPNITDNDTWKTDTRGAFSYYGNDEATYKKFYGALYNWYAVNTGKLCPDGWHVPVNKEFDVLKSYIANNGGKLKEFSTTHWTTPNTGATNETGYTALPGGSRSNYDGTFRGIGNYGFWWTASSLSYAMTNYSLILEYKSSNLVRYDIVGDNPGSGYSVRCVKGEITKPSVITNSPTNISPSSVILEGTVTNSGGIDISGKGFAWSNSPDFLSINYITLTGGSSSGNYSSGLYNLSPNTTYYVRAYAENSIGRSYGQDVSFTTLVPTVPIVYTQPVTAVSSSSAFSGGFYSISWDGGLPITSWGVCWSTSQNPTIDNNKTSEPLGGGNGFKSGVSGLISNTTYYLRAYVSNAIGTGYGPEVSFHTLNQFVYGPKISDIDGNSYNTITIGTQTWMAENLKTTRYANGTSLNLVNSVDAWNSLNESDKAYCYYNDNAEFGKTYGALYSWSAAMNGASGSNSSPSGVQGVCPAGWHLPSNAEWTTLQEYLGTIGTAGGKMKEVLFDHWTFPNADATNESGFTALAGGIRQSSGVFKEAGIRADFWTSSTESNSNVYSRGLTYSGGPLILYTVPKDMGLSVRCIKSN